MNQHQEERTGCKCGCEGGPNNRYCQTHLCDEHCKEYRVPPSTEDGRLGYLEDATDAPDWEQAEREAFEAIMLDGDSINSCGGAMLSASEVFLYMIERMKEARNAALEEAHQKCREHNDDINSKMVIDRLSKERNKALEEAAEAIDNIDYIGDVNIVKDRRNVMATIRSLKK